MYANMAEKFEIYIDSLPLDEIDENKNDFRVNENGLLSVRQTESAVELFDSIAVFYYISGRLPYMEHLLWNSCWNYWSTTKS